MYDMRLGPVGSYVALNPEYDYEFVETIDRQDMRTKQGNLYTYIEDNSWHSFRLPLSWVNSSQRSLVNSWWKTGTDLRFIDRYETYYGAGYYGEAEDYGGGRYDDYRDVRVMGTEEPFNNFVQPYFQTYYAGEIVIETI